MSDKQNKILDFIVHKLIKEAHEKTADVDIRPSTLTVNPSVQRLVDEIHKLYLSKLGKGYGRFESDEDNYPFPKYIKEHFSENKYDFHPFSEKLMRHLKERAKQEPLATGGYVLIAKVENDSTTYLLVAMVTEVIGSAITNNLDVIDSTHLDMSQLRVAGRIDITAWQNGHDRYISFIKGRSDIATYFKLFLGCNDVVVAAQESKKLVHALESFALAQQMSADERDNLLATAYHFLNDLSKNGNPVSLDALANHIYPQAPDKLKEKFADDSIELSDDFVPDRRAIKSLIKFSGKSNHWQIIFDRKGIRDGSVRYDKDSDTIILSAIPDDLKQELIEEHQDADE